MRKQKSIRRTVRTVLGLVYATRKGEGIPHGLVHALFGKQPEKYVVRYKLAKRGKRGRYLVSRSRPAIIGFDRVLPVCFLPRAWWGKRVNRDTWPVRAQ